MHHLGHLVKTNSCPYKEIVWTFYYPTIATEFVPNEYVDEIQLMLAGIDFKKGCFVGQETTSRMKRRGTVKTRFLPLAFEGEPPSPGAEVLAGDLRAGQVLSTGEGLAMASLRLDRIEGADLTADGRPVRVVRPDWFEEAVG